MTTLSSVKLVNFKAQINSTTVINSSVPSAVLFSPSGSLRSFIRIRNPEKPKGLSVFKSDFLHNGLSSKVSNYFSLQNNKIKKGKLFKVSARRGGESVGAIDRVIGSLGYFLPLLDGWRYGRYIFLQFPASRILIEPLVPLIRIYSGFPFASVIVFFAIYIGVIQNQSFSRFVRFNCMQAVVLDILMILPSLFERLVSQGNDTGATVVILLYNTVFIYLFACFLFGVGSCLLGKEPRLPLVANAADAQVPF